MLLALLLALAPLHAAEPAPTPEPSAVAAAYDVLQEARELYLAGSRSEARARFLDLVRRAQVLGDVPFDVEARALVYLGELALFDGRDADAGRFFRLVLVRDREYGVDEYEHPERVRSAFELERLALPEPDAPQQLRAMPWWGYAPFGVPQFKQRRPVRGAVYATLQVGFAAASVAAWFVLDQQAVAITDRSLEEDVRNQVRDRAILIRDAWSTGTAAAFYVTWAASSIDGGLSWRRDQVRPPVFTLVPRQDGVAIDVAWRF